MAARVILRVPDRQSLGAYEEALRGGWSPNTTRDVAPEQLSAIESDPDGFLAGLLARGGRVRLNDGSDVDKIPDRTRWVFAQDRSGEPFVGSINLRWLEQPEGRPVEVLPPHVLGHVGYSIRPAFAGNGYATAALAAMIGEARDIGLPRIVITCDASNHASRRIIERNGGRLLETFTAPIYGPGPRLRFSIEITP